MENVPPLYLLRVQPKTHADQQESSKIRGLLTPEHLPGEHVELYWVRAIL